MRSEIDEKQIDEFAVDVWRLRGLPATEFAEKMFDKGYRKLFVGAVVITKDEYEELKKCREMSRIVFSEEKRKCR